MMLSEKHLATLEAFGDTAWFVEQITTAIATATAPLHAQIVQLKKQVTDLEQRRGLEFKGVWRDADSYGVHDVVSDRGCMWVALRGTRKRPGEGADWQLAVKAGRDGK